MSRDEILFHIIASMDTGPIAHERHYEDRYYDDDKIINLSCHFLIIRRRRESSNIDISIMK